MVNPAVLAKAAAAALTDEQTRERLGWVIAALLSPLFVLAALLCTMASGTSEHNNAAVQQSFHGGTLSASIPAEFQEQLEAMQDSFSELDRYVDEINRQVEDRDGLDADRVKAIFLDKDGIAKIKSGLAKNIFRQELTEIYQQQTQRRDELVKKSGEVMQELIRQMRSGTLENPRIQQLTSELADRLKNTSGRKQYGYLKAPLKAVVDEIVDELAKDSRVAAAYDLWYQLREEVLRTYRDGLPERLPLSQQKEFKQIKNLVIREAARVSEYAEAVLPDDDIDAVFVGRDENGLPRHAHKRSVNNLGKTFRINVEGSDPRYSFHYTGTSDRLYVFEAPIDLLSFLTRYPRGWQEHSFVSLCGTSEHAMLWMLEQNPVIQRIGLCLDHDAAGIEAAGRLEDILLSKGYSAVQRFLPEYKDWNEDLKARCGLLVQEAEEHPQLIAAPEVCRRIAQRTGSSRLNYWEQDIPNLIDYCKTSLRWGHFDRAMECMEQASAIALAIYSRELRQLKRPLSPEELSEELRGGIRPHQNRSSLKARPNELTAQFQDIQAKATTRGIRSETEKWELADCWLELAVSFAKVPVKYEAEIIKQQHNQEQAVP